MVAIPTPDGDDYDSLEDFAGHVNGVAKGLFSLGYEVNDPAATWNWTAAEMNEGFRDLVDDDDGSGVRVVHILGHGERSHGTVFPVGADGQTDDDCDVVNWLKLVQSNNRLRPKTLFILDTCHSGEATRSEWGLDIHAEDLRGWVLAASERDRSAYDGRLTRAVANQLAAVAGQTMGLAPDLEFVPWETFRDKVIHEVERGAGDRLLPQRVTSTLLNRTVKVPFFPNPAYVEPGPFSRQRMRRLRGWDRFWIPSQAQRCPQKASKASIRTISPSVLAAETGLVPTGPSPAGEASSLICRHGSMTLLRETACELSLAAREQGNLPSSAF